MEVSIKFVVDSLEDIQPYLVGQQHNLVRNLQLECERLREQLAALQKAVGSEPTEEPNVGDRDAEGTPFDPAQHSGTRTAKGAWRRKRVAQVAAPEVSAPVAEPKGEITGGAPISPPKVGSKPISLDDFRAAVNAAVTAHPGGVEAGKKFAKTVLLKFGSESMKTADPAKYAEIIAELKNVPAAGDDEDGL